VVILEGNLDEITPGFPLTCNVITRGPVKPAEQTLRAEIQTGLEQAVLVHVVCPESITSVNGGGTYLRAELFIKGLEHENIEN
jgi:hypothetical protein